MERLVAWKSHDGQFFESEEACLRHEKTISTSILNAFVLAFDRDGKQINWAGYETEAHFALLLSYPSDEILEDPIFDKAWADYLDSDLEEELTLHKACGWYVRDPYSEMWYRWADYEKEFNNIRCTISRLGEKHGG